jgi:hypothetical protein
MKCAINLGYNVALTNLGLVQYFLYFHLFTNKNNSSDAVFCGSGC